MVSQLKADQEKRQNQLTDIVSSLMAGQTCGQLKEIKPVKEIFEELMS